MFIEHDVVRTFQGMAVALGVERFDLAGVEVDALDAAARVAVRGMTRHRHAVHLHPFEAAVVADVAGAVGAMAAPLGPPPTLAMTCCLPSGLTRVSVPRLISTATAIASIATGPSGNCEPEVISRICAMVFSSPSLDLRATRNDAGDDDAWARVGCA